MAPGIFCCAIRPVTGDTVNGGTIRIDGNLTAGGTITVEQDALAKNASGITINSPSATSGIFTAGRDILIRQSGTADFYAIDIYKTVGENNNIISTGGSIKVEQTANSTVKTTAIRFIDSFVSAKGDVTINQLGTVTQTATRAAVIKFSGVDLGQTQTSSSGPPTYSRGFLSIKSQFGTVAVKTNNLPLTFAKTDHFTIAAQRLIFDLGTGAATTYNNSNDSVSDSTSESTIAVNLIVGDFLYSGGATYDHVAVTASETVMGVTTTRTFSSSQISIKFDLNGGVFYRAKVIDGAGSTLDSSFVVPTIAARPEGMKIENASPAFGSEMTVDPMPGGNPTPNFTPVAIANSPLGGTAVVYINDGSAGLTIDSSRVTSLGVNYIGASKITLATGANAVYNFTGGVKLSASDGIVLGTNIGDNAAATPIENLSLQFGAAGIAASGSFSISASTLHLDSSLSASTVEISNTIVSNRGISAINATTALYLRGTANSTYSLNGANNAIAAIRLGTSGLGNIAVTSSVSTTIFTDNNSTLGSDLAVTVTGTGNSLTVASLNLNNKNLSLTATGNIILGNIFESTGVNGSAVGTNSASTLTLTSSAGSVSQAASQKIIVGKVTGSSYGSFVLGNNDNQIANLGNIKVTGVTPQATDVSTINYSVITILSKSSMTVLEDATLQTDGGAIFLNNRIVNGVQTHDLTVLGTLRVNNQNLLPTGVLDSTVLYPGRISLNASGVITNKKADETAVGVFEAAGYFISTKKYFDIKLTGHQNLRGELISEVGSSSFVVGGDLTINNSLSLSIGTYQVKTDSLTLESLTGSISQTRGQITQTVQNNPLNLKASSGNISLMQKGNQLTALGEITAGGDIVIRNYLNVTTADAAYRRAGSDKAMLRLTNNISTSGTGKTIKIFTNEPLAVAVGNNAGNPSTDANHSINVTKDITITGGEVTLDLGKDGARSSLIMLNFDGTLQTSYGSVSKITLATDNKNLNIKLSQLDVGTTTTGTLFALATGGELRETVDSTVTFTQSATAKIGYYNLATTTTLDADGIEWHNMDDFYRIGAGTGGIFTAINSANRITQGGTATTSAYTAPSAVTGPANTAEYSFKNVSATRSDAMAITGTKFNFLGSNSFNNLSLTSTGAVTQAAGSSVVVSGKFAVSASGQTVTLDLTGNRFGSLGDITATSATIYLGGDTQTTSLTDTITVTTGLSLLGDSALTLGKTGGLSMTTTSGTISLSGRSMTLTSAVTTTGGAVTITLGTGATNIYANGAAVNSFTTTDQNLTLTAGSVTVTGGTTEKLFKLGTADFRDGSLSAAVLNATHAASKTILVWDGVGTAPTFTPLTEELHTLAEFATKYLPTGLAASNITAASSAPALVTTAITDSLTFVGGSFTGAVALTLAANKSFSFKGSNSFSDTLSLTTTGTGTITQDPGSSLRMAAGKALSISAGGLVNLGETTNQITTINGLTSGGLLTLTTTTDLSIGGTITTAGAASAITITAARLTLSSDVTATGGDARITVTGAFNNASYKWTTGGKNVTISFGSVNVTGVAFDIGAGTFDQTLTGGYSKQVGVYTLGADISDTSYDWRTLATLTNARGFDAANVDKLAAGTFKVVTGGQLKEQTVTFFGVTANSDLVIDAKAVLFKNTNSFTNLTITTYGTSGDGSVTQAAGSSVVVSGSLTVTAATGSDVILTEGGNRIAAIAGLSGRNLAVTTGGNLQFTGDANATGTSSYSSVNLIVDALKTVSGSTLTITASGDVTMNGSLSATAGALSLTASGTGKTINFASGGSITASNATLPATDKGTVSITTKGATTIASSITAGDAVTLTADDNLTLTGSISAAGTGLSVTKAKLLRIGGTGFTVTAGAFSFTVSGLTLTSAISTTGGAVTIDLNNGEFNDNNSANQTDRFTWTSNNQNVTVKNLGTLTTRTTASQKAFALGSGNFIQEGSSGTQITKDKVLVVKALGEDLTELFDKDIYQTIIAADLSSSSGARFASTDVTTTGTVTIPAAGLNLTTKEVHFYRVRTIATAAVGSATFYGENQLGGLTTTSGSVTLTDGATLVGDYSLSGSTITLGSQTLLKGVITNTTGTLTLNLKGDYLQMVDGGSFNITDGTLKVVGNSYSINLSNPANVLSTTATIAVDTNGGNFQLATGSSINSTSLRTAGGWVVLRSGGNINVSGLETGRVSFRATGWANLEGSFAGADGQASSIVLKSGAAGVVIGALAASSSVTLNGSGTAILTGDIVSNSSTEITQKVVVAGPVSILASAGGVVSTTSTINAIAASISNSLLISVGSGQINLGGSIGSTTRLGWVQLEGYNLNSSGGVSISWFDGTGTPSLSDSKPYWRNGSNF